MLKNRKDSLIEHIINTSFSIMGESQAIVSPCVNCPGKGMPDGKYYIQLTRISSNNLLLQELILNSHGDNIVFRHWTFKKEKKWDVLSLEKNKKHIYLRDLPVELEDLSRRIVLLQRVFSTPGFFYADEVEALSDEMTLPQIPVRRNGIGAVYQWFLDFSIRPAIFVPIVVSVLILLSVVTGIYAIKMNNLNKEIDGSIEEYITELETKLETLTTFKDSAESDMARLIGNLEMEQADLEFNRQNAYVNVLRLAEELSIYHPARKESYRLIAENIRDTVSFGEIVYEMSRLPTAEYQARIFLATDRQKIVPLGRFEPVFSSMAFPVQVEGKENDGMGFRISDGYMEKREDPLGSGGTSPHYAVDILNVANIAHISYSGEIVREGNPFGDVVAVQEGMVKAVSFNEKYGWNIEIEHPLSAEIKKIYPQALGWTTYYAHMAGEPEIEGGDWVDKGKPLGKIGNTGRSTGPHLHFELRIYQPKGLYRDEAGNPFEKVNPYPGE